MMKKAAHLDVCAPFSKAVGTVAYTTRISYTAVVGPFSPLCTLSTKFTSAIREPDRLCGVRTHDLAKAATRQVALVVGRGG